MLICVADLAEFFESRPESKLANPAGYSKSIDLEPFHKRSFYGVLNPTESY
jgi:hypothetical protein